MNTMLRLMRVRERISVVNDQFGSPTGASGLAECLWKFVANGDLAGRYHWSDSGVATWHEFALAIQDIGLQLGLLESRVPIVPVGTAEYPTPARRPVYSALDCSGTCAALDMVPSDWRTSLRSTLEQFG